MNNLNLNDIQAVLANAAESKIALQAEIEAFEGRNNPGDVTWIIQVGPLSFVEQVIDDSVFVMADPNKAMRLAFGDACRLAATIRHPEHDIEVVNLVAALRDELEALEYSVNHFTNLLKEAES